MDQLALFGGNPARTSTPPEWPIFDETERHAVLSVVNSGEWGRLGGCVTQSVEAQFAALTTSKYAIAVNSGQTALRLAILALNPPAGAEILSLIHI